MKSRMLVRAAVLASVLCSCVLASPINPSGTFNIAGTITVDNGTMKWNSNNSPFPANKATIGPGATGDFMSLGGTDVTIQNLNLATEPVGPTFPQQLFISFDAAPLLQALDINQIFAGLYGTAQCTLAPAPGQQCTPSAPVTPVPVSPFNFVNNPPPAAPQATATFAFAGVTANGLSSWTGNFTVQFGDSFQDELNKLATTGHVTNTYSATFTVLSPEPEGVALVGIGLGLVAVSLRIRRRPHAR